MNFILSMTPADWSRTLPANRLEEMLRQHSASADKTTDLAGREAINFDDISEAISYRTLDRQKGMLGPVG